MIVKILTGLFLIGVCFFMIRIIYDFVKSIIEHKKTMKDLDEWHLFHKKLMSWSDEITDNTVKNEYIQYCVSLLLMRTNKVNVPSIEEVYQYIIDNYSHHIPSLLREVRSNKLNELINQ